MTYKKPYATPPSIGAATLNQNVGGNFMVAPVNNFSFLSTPGTVPATGGPAGLATDTGLTFAGAAIDTGTFTISGVTYGPAIWFPCYGGVVRYDENTSTMYQVSFNDIPGGIVSLIDLSYGGSKIWAITNYGIIKVNTNVFQWGVEKYITSNNLGGGTGTPGLGSTAIFDSTNNQLIYFSTGDNNLYSIDVNLNVATSHTVDTSGVTSFKNFYSSAGLNSYMKGLCQGGFYYLPVVDLSNVVWILKINTSNFTTVSSLNTGATAITSGAGSSAFGLNLAYSAGSNLMFFSSATGIVKIDLSTFTVTQTLTSTTTNGAIAIDDIGHHLAVIDTADAQHVYQINTFNTTMTFGATRSLTPPHGYFNTAAIYNIVTIDGQNFYVLDSNNDFITEFALGTGVILNSIGVGTAVNWQISNLLNSRVFSTGVSTTTTQTIDFNETFIPCDTTAGAFTVTLPFNQKSPASGGITYPVVGEYHVICDGKSTGSFGTHNLTVSGGGNNIWFGGTSSASITLSTNGQVVTFYYLDVGATTYWVAK